MSRLAYNDAEKGTLEVRSPQLAPNPDLAKSEKKSVDLDVFPVRSLKKDAPLSPSNVAKPPPQPPKPKKMKTSKYIQFIIWYNSYRSVLPAYLSFSHSYCCKGGFSQSSLYSTLPPWVSLQLVSGRMP